MAKTVAYTSEDSEKYGVLSDVLQLEDLEVVREEFDIANNRYIFYCKLRFPLGVCPQCGRICTQVHDYPNERRIHDAPIRGCNVLLVYNSVRLSCSDCGTVFSLEVRDVVPGCSYTYRLAAEIADPTRKQDVATLARLYDLGYKTVESIILNAAKATVEARTAAPIVVKRLGVDEINIKKGQGNYVLVLTDLDRRILLDILPDRRQATLEDWLRQPPAGIALDTLESAATDLWSGYKSAILAVFPHVQVVADRFHIVKQLHETINDERRKAQSNAKSDEERKLLKGLRYLLLKNSANLTDSERARLEALRTSHPKLYQLWHLRQQLHDLYEQHISPRAAKKALNAWIRRARRLGLRRLTQFTRTLVTWKREVLNFFTHRITSGFVEGMNSKLRLLRRIAFGLPNFAHFRLRMLWACG